MAKEGAEEEGWEARFARFKKEHEARNFHEEPDIASDIRSEGGDTVGKLPTISVIGGKKRRKGASDASGYSMSSSSIYRNEGLSLLDERFDEVKIPIYFNSFRKIDIIGRSKRRMNQTKMTSSPRMMMKRLNSSLHEKTSMQSWTTS